MGLVVENLVLIEVPANVCAIVELLVVASICHEISISWLKPKKSGKQYMEPRVPKKGVRYVLSHAYRACRWNGQKHSEPSHLLQLD